MASKFPDESYHVDLLKQQDDYFYSYFGSESANKLKILLSCLETKGVLKNIEVQRLLNRMPDTYDTIKGLLPILKRKSGDLFLKFLKVLKQKAELNIRQDPFWITLKALVQGLSGKELSDLKLPEDPYYVLALQSLRRYVARTDKDISQYLPKLEVVLQPVQEKWEQLGLSLDINQSVLSSIKSTPGDSTMYMRQLLKKWSTEGGQLDDLADGLKSIEREDLISGLIEMMEISTDTYVTDVQTSEKQQSLEEELKTKEMKILELENSLKAATVKDKKQGKMLSEIETLRKKLSSCEEELLQYKTKHSHAIKPVVQSGLLIRKRSSQFLEEVPSPKRQSLTSSLPQMVEMKEGSTDVTDIEMSDDKLHMVEKEIQSKSKELSVVKKDVSVQFDYLTDTLRGVHVGNKNLFLIQGDCPQSFNWEEYGLRISVPQGTLSVKETCKISARALVGGQFAFPEGTEPISIVYTISIAKPLLKPVKLEIQHCAHLVTEDHTSYLSFATASSKQPVLPYQFQLLKGGKFYPGNQYGSISLSHFCHLVIIKSPFCPIEMLLSIDNTSDTRLMKGTKVPNLAVVSKLFINSMPA